MIVIEWHLLVYVIVNLVIFTWAITRDKTEGLIGSDRGWAMILFLLFLIVSTLLYGGIFWW